MSRQPLPIGISTASFFMRCETEEAVTKIGEMGAPVCEVMLNAPSEYGAEFAKEIRRRADDTGLRVHSAHVLSMRYEMQLFSFHQRQFRDALAEFSLVCDAAAIMGAQCHTFHGQAFIKNARTIDGYNYPFLAERFGLLQDVCQERGLRLAIENVCWCTYNQPGFAGKLLAQEPGNIGFTLDLKQAQLSGHSWEEYLSDIGDKLRTVHLCDYEQSGRPVMPGRGVCDFIRLFDRLYATDYAGPCLLEVYEESYGDIGELASCYRELVRWAKEGYERKCQIHRQRMRPA